MKQILKWSAPAACLLLSLFLHTAVQGYSFLSLVFFCIAAIIVCFYLIGMMKTKHAKAAKILNTVLIGALSIGLLVYLVTGAFILDAAHRELSEVPEYIVVLGAGLRGSDPSPILSDRIHTAYAYLTEHPEVICIASGGQGENEDISEAQCIFEHLTEMGISEERIWLEDKSTSTWENFKFTLALIEEKTGGRPEKLGVLSNDFHLFRAGMFAEECGITPIGISAPTSQLLLRVNYYLREVAGVWHYLILGGQYHD
ncbi:MAG: YdcF family protein [Ruminococcaceae bacterium]|nr:YdcF family protein [Oscillospiraceae bacterium]